MSDFVIWLVLCDELGQVRRLEEESLILCLEILFSYLLTKTLRYLVIIVCLRVAFQKQVLDLRSYPVTILTKGIDILSQSTFASLTKEVIYRRLLEAMALEVRKNKKRKR